MTSWTPVALIWGAIIAAAVYFAVVWWQTGRDPRRGTIIPQSAPPGDLSPMMLSVIHRSMWVGDFSINPGTLGSLAELIRRGIVTVEEGANGEWRVLPRDGGDWDDIPQDLVDFLNRLLPGGQAASGDGFRKAAAQYSTETVAAVRAQMYRFDPPTLWRVGVPLLAATMLTILLAGELTPGANIGFPAMVGFFIGVVVLLLLLTIPSKIRGRIFDVVVMGLVVAGCAAAAVVLVMPWFGQPLGTERALVWMGLFVTWPVYMAGLAAIRSMTPEAQRLADAVAGFRLFIATADGGRHAIHAPDPTTNRLDRLAPYAIALDVESGWVNALARKLPIKQPRPAE